MTAGPRALRGAAAGLAAAALFGLSAPLGKWLVGEVHAVLLAGLLYGGAALGFWALRAARGPTRDEAPLRRGDLPAVLGLALLGGAVGPVLMLVGLARVSGLAGALLLNLEAPLTILVAGAFFGEHVGRRVALAATCVVAGATLLGLRPGEAAADPLGAGAIALACAAWAVDNNLTQRLATKDPFAIVRVKATVGAAANLSIAGLLGLPWPAWKLVVVALSIGLASYGVSVLLDAYALRLVGAAREAAYFATAPFLGALVAFAVFRERPELVDLAALAAMLVGVALLLRERHAHRHVHEPMEHEHGHVHDEHHRHAHAPGTPPGEPHVHVHQHDRLDHEHEHVPDIHHRHPHRRCS